MTKRVEDVLPQYPILRPVVAKWIESSSEVRYLRLEDRMDGADRSVLVPQSLVSLLYLCDGTHEIDRLRYEMLSKTAFAPSDCEIRELLLQLDLALLLQNGRFAKLEESLLNEYRGAKARTPIHANSVYPSDPTRLKNTLAGYLDSTENVDLAGKPDGNLMGIVSPHIDYIRGHRTYSRLWRAAGEFLNGIELVIIMGTDHWAGSGMFTLTRQNYSTPLGIHNTDQLLVDGLANIIGEEEAFKGEGHHIKEHSVELALVWLSYTLAQQKTPIVPILCGSFYDFINEGVSPLSNVTISGVVDFLRSIIATRRTLIIAAGDLAHVGPAFGDPRPMTGSDRVDLAHKDSKSISAICEGDPNAFITISQAELDSRRICGLSCIYTTLEILRPTAGQSVGYEQCDADSTRASVVSIFGGLLFNKA